jgi:hypothetical protein
MWIRSLLLVCAMGCVGVGPADDENVASQPSTIPFHCLDTGSIHVVVCSGSISLFPITITIDELSILSDNHIDILSDDLDDLAVLDGDLVDHDRILDDAESRVLGDFLDKFHLTVSRDRIAVCTVVAGAQLCR